MQKMQVSASSVAAINPREEAGLARSSDIVHKVGPSKVQGSGKRKQAYLRTIFGQPLEKTCVRLRLRRQDSLMYTSWTHLSLTLMEDKDRIETC